MRYIDRNPVKAGIVDHPGKWEMGSFGSYAYGKAHDILPLKPHPTYLSLAKQKTKRRAFYLSFVLEKDDLSDDLHGKLARMRVLGSTEFVEEVKRASAEN